MAAPVKIRRVGNSLGVILTKDVVESLGVRRGDELFAIRTPDGILLTPYDPNFARAIESTRDYMRRHRNAMQRACQEMRQPKWLSIAIFTAIHDEGI